MALAYELIKKLRDDEITLVLSLPLQDREREVLTIMASYKKKVFPSSSICKRLNINAAHLDKIKSVILKKVLDAIAGDNIFSQIGYLNTKSGLWGLSAHLLKKHEQKLILEQSGAHELLAFYKFCFEWSVTVPFSGEDQYDLVYYSDKILLYSSKESYAATELWLQIVLLRKEIAFSASHAQASNEEKIAQIETKLNDLLERSAQSGLPNLLYKAQLAAIFFYNLLFDYKKSYPFIHSINALLTNHAGLFSDEEKLIAKWHEAQILYFSSKFDESYAVYDQIYNHVPKGSPSKWFSLYAEFLQVCLVTHHYDKALIIYNFFLDHFNDDVNGSFYISSVLQMIKYLLFTKNFEQAFIYLQKIKLYISKTQPLQFQFVYRELVVAYYYLTENYVAAEVAADKNLKFLRFKGVHKLIPEYTYHSRLTKALCKNQKLQKTLTARDQDMLDEMQKGTFKQFGILLLQFKNHIAANKAK